MDGGASLGQARAEIVLDAAKAMAALSQFGAAANQTMQQVGQSGTTAASGFDRFSQAVSTPRMQVAGGALLGIGTAVAAVGGFALNSAMQFEQGMANVSAATGATGAELPSLSDLALQIGKDTSFGATEATLAIEELAKAGVSTEDILNGAADATVALAAAGGVALPEAATVMSSAMNQFGLAAGDASGYYDEFGNEINNAGHIADVLAGAASASATGVSEMGASLSYVGTSAAALGVPIEDTTTALALMANQGIVGSSAGTSLNQVLLSLANPTNKARGAMDELGLSFTDMNGNMLPLPDIIGQVATATTGMGDAQRAAYLETLFGVEGGRAMNALLASQSEEVAGTTQSWDGMNAAVTEVGVAQEQADARLNSTSGRLEGLKGTVETLGITFGMKLLPFVDAVIVGLTSLLGAILELPSGVQTAIAVVTGLAGAFAGITGAAILMGPKLIQLGQGFRTVSVAMRALTLSNPVFLAIAAAIGVAILAVEAYKHNWLGFGDAVRSVAGWVGDAVSGVVNGIASFIDRFRNAFSFLTSGETSRIIHDLAGNITTAMVAIQNPMQVTEALFHALANAIRGIGGETTPAFLVDLAAWLDRFAPKAQAFVDKIQEMGSWLKNIFSSGDAEAELERFSGALQPIMHGLGKIVDVAHDLKAAFGKGFLNGLKAIPGELQQLGDGFRLIFTGIGQVVDNLGKKFPVLGRTFSALGDLFRSVGDVVGSVFDVIATIASGGSVEEVGGAFLELGKNIGRVFLDWEGVLASAMADMLSLLQNGVGRLFDYLSGRFTSFSSTFDMLGGVITNIIGVVRNLYEAFIALLNGDWAGVWENLQDAFTDAVQAILYAAALLPTLILEKFTGMSWSELGTKIVDAFDAAWDAIRSGASGLAEDIGQAIGDAVGAVSGWIGSGWDVLTGFIGEVVNGAVATWNDSIGAIKSFFTNLATDLKGLVSSGWDVLSGFMAEVVAGAASAWDASVGAVKAFFINLAADLIGLVGTGWDLLSGFVAEILSGAVTAWNASVSGLKGFFTGLAADLIGLLSSGRDVLAGFIAEIIAGAADAWNASISGVKSFFLTLSTDLIGLVGDGKDVLSGFIAQVINGAVTAWDASISGLKTIFTNLGSDLLNLLNLDELTVPDFSFILDPIQTLSDDITAIVNWVTDTAWPKLTGWASGLSSSLGQPDFLSTLGPIQAISDTVSAVADWVTNTAWPKLTGWADTIAGSLGVPHFSAFIGPIQAISDTITRVKDWITGTAWPAMTRWSTSVTGSLGVPDFSAFVAPFQAMSDSLTGIFDWIKGKFDWFIDAVDSLPEPPGWLADLIAGGGAILNFGAGGAGAAADTLENEGNSDEEDKNAGKFGYGGGADKSARALNGATSGLAAMLTDLQAFVTAVQIAAATVMQHISNMKIGVVADVTDTVNTTIALAGAWAVVLPAIAFNTASPILIHISNMKIGVVADVADMVNTTIGTAGGWQTGMVAIAATLAATVMTHVSNMKIGTVADVRDMDGTSRSHASTMKTGITSDVRDMDSTVRASVSTMKIGVVADLRDTEATGKGHLSGLETSDLGSMRTLDSNASSSAQDAKGSITRAFEEAASQSIRAVSGMQGDIVGAIARIAGPAGSEGRNVGSAIGSGINSGISSWTNTIASTAASAVNAAITAAKNAAAIASPSRRARDEVGVPISQGIAVGIERAARDVASSAVAAVTGAITAAQRTAARAERYGSAGLTGSLAGTGGAMSGSQPSLPIALPVVSPLPVRPSVTGYGGSGPVVNITMTNTFQGVAGGQDAVNQFGSALRETELPALTNVIKRSLGG